MNNIYIGAYAGVLDEKNNIWLSDCQHNALFRYNTINKKIKYMGRFPGCDILSSDNHIDVKIVNDTFVFIPIEMGLVYFYYPKDNRFIKLEIPEHEGKINYCGSIIVDNRVYFASQAGKIFCADVSKRKIEKIMNLTDTSNFAYEIEKTSIFHVSGYNKGFAYFLSKSEKLCLFDIYGNKKIFIDMKGINGKIHTISKIEEKIYITFKKGSYIAEYDLKTNKKIVYENVEEKGKILPFQNVIDIDGKKIVLNMYCENICYLNPEKKEICKLEDIPSTRGWGRNDQLYGPMFSNVIKQDNLYYFIPCRSKKMLIFDSYNKIYSSIDFFIEPENYNDYRLVLDELCKRYEIVNEGFKGFILDRFITSLVNLKE